MSTIVTRAGKGSPLTHTEVDSNFTNLNTDKVEASGGTLTNPTINGTVTTTGLNFDSNTLVIDSTNNRVGVGTASPTNPLTINKGDDDGIRIRTADSNYSALNFGVSSGNIAYIQSQAYGSGTVLPLAFYTGGSERMRIDSSGNVGIGTSSPSAIGKALNVYNPSGGNNPSTLALEGDAGNKFLVNYSGASVDGAAIFSNSGIRFGYATSKAAAGYTDQLVLNTSGNLGLGVTPSAWFSTVKAFQFGSTGSVEGRTNSGSIALASNLYIDTGGDYRYITSNYATRYQQNAGQHIFYTAASGTAGNIPTLTQVMTLDASGNLGVGTSSPISNSTFTTLTVNGTNSIIELTRSNSRAGRLYVDSSATVLASYTATPLILGTSDTERMRIDSSGNLLVGNTSYTDATKGILNSQNGRLYATADGAVPLNLNRLSSTGGLAAFKYASSVVGGIDVTSSGVTYTGTNGVTFTATQTASADANTLDDYEEGSFTPTIKGNGTAGTATYSTQEGYYTKIGNLVWFSLFVNWTGGTGSGSMQISGLPFTCRNVANYPSLSIGQFENISYSGVPMAYVSPNTTVIVLQSQPSNGSSSGIAYDAAGDILIAGSYQVA
jgi:hypothetical protein